MTAADGSTQQITGKNVVLAAGSVPRILPGFEVDGRYVHTSDEVLSLRLFRLGRGDRRGRHRL